MAVSNQPNRYENSVIEHMKNIKQYFTKPMLYWMARKSIINNYFFLCKWLVQELAIGVKSEKIVTWFEILKNLCNICSSDNDGAKSLQILSI